MSGLAGMKFKAASRSRTEQLFQSSKWPFLLLSGHSGYPLDEAKERNFAREMKQRALASLAAVRTYWLWHFSYSTRKRSWTR